MSNLSSLPVGGNCLIWPGMRLVIILKCMIRRNLSMPLIEDDLSDLPPIALKYTENSYYKAVTSGGKEREGCRPTWPVSVSLMHR